MANQTRARLAVLFVFAIAITLGCDPSLPTPKPGVHPDAGAAEVVTVTLEPSAPLDAAAPILRVHVAVSGSSSLDPTSFWLIHGAVSTAQLRELASAAPSMALAERIVPSIRWRDAATGAVVIAPTVALVAGETYAIAGLDPPAIEALVIMADDPAPVLARVWPPLGAAATSSFGIWCGDAGLPPLGASVSLEPAGPTGTLSRGAVDDLGSSCARFEGDGGGAGPFVPPPAIDAGEVMRLDPRAFESDAAAAPFTRIGCVAGEVDFGPGCARVADDRVEVRAPIAPLLWAIAGSGLDTVRITDGESPLVLAHFAPQTKINFTLGVIDTAGTTLRASFRATTLAPQAHVILNEVMAHPLGPEPQEEWIELYNDGSAPADLEGFVLLDPGGGTPLPQGMLAPGAFALLVNDGFEQDDAFDPPPAPGTLLIRVPKLGHNGLSDQGEQLALKDGGGVVVSRFPASPKPKLGVSVVRVDPLSPDEAALSFAVSKHAASPGAPNDP